MKKKPTKREELELIRKVMWHQLKATRKLTDAQHANTLKLNRLIERESWWGLM